MILRDFLTIQNVAVDESPAYFRMTPSVPLAWMIGADKAPIKAHSMTQLEVPIHHWASEAEESMAIVRVMANMAEGVTVGAVSYAAMDQVFWNKLKHNLKAMIMHPALDDRFFVPDATVIFTTEVLPLDRVLCLGAPGKSGTLLAQRGRSGYILPLQRGITAVRIYNLS